MTLSVDVAQRVRIRRAVLLSALVAAAQLACTTPSGAERARAEYLEQLARGDGKAACFRPA